MIQDGDRRLFGSSLIRDYLHRTYGRGTGDYPANLTRPKYHWEDLQVLTAIETMTNALVHYFHARWAGVTQHGENRLGGVDIAGREMARALSLLDWLEDQAGKEGFWPETVSPADMALAAALLWTEAREEIPWRGRPKLELIVETMDARESMKQTAPRPWPDSPKGRLRA